MQTILIFSDSEKNLELVRKQMKKKYKSLEELFSKVQKSRCNEPELVDDYMVWQTIKAHDKEHGLDADHEDDGHKADNAEIPTRLQAHTRLHPAQDQLLSYNEEIIIQTTDFYSVPTPRRMEILEYIQKHNPDSMKNLAAETGRDYKNVYDDVLALQKAHLLELVSEGKNKRPVSRLTSIEILFKK